MDTLILHAMGAPDALGTLVLMIVGLAVALFVLKRPSLPRLRRPPRETSATVRRRSVRR